MPSKLILLRRFKQIVNNSKVIVYFIFICTDVISGAMATHLVLP